MLLAQLLHEGRMELTGLRNEEPKPAIRNNEDVARQELGSIETQRLGH